MPTWSHCFLGSPEATVKTLFLSFIWNAYTDKKKKKGEHWKLFFTDRSFLLSFFFFFFSPITVLWCNKVTDTNLQEWETFISISPSQVFIIVLTLTAFVQDSNQMEFQKIFTFPLSLYATLFIVTFVDKYVECCCCCY